MSNPTLVTGNKNDSSWSLRPWLALRRAGIPSASVSTTPAPPTPAPFRACLPSWYGATRRMKSRGSWPERSLTEGEGIVAMSNRIAGIGNGPVRTCRDDEFRRIHAIVNDAAAAYRGVIPHDRWREPYMSEAALEAEIAAGVRFLGWYAPPDTLLGVMGAQDVQDVTLIRHAYVLSAHQRGGIGSALIAALTDATARPLLVGTWKAATWAVAFYERHGFRLVEDTATLLRRYWTIPDRQIETSVVLADRRWFAREEPDRGASA